MLHAAPSDLEPGQYVRHPTQPDWGLGQVQSAIGPRVTVTFADQGKVTINTDIIALLPTDPSLADTAT